MWDTKEFKTQEEMDKWIEEHSKTHQITPIYIDNGFGVEYKECRKIGYDWPE